MGVLINPLNKAHDEGGRKYFGSTAEEARCTMTCAQTATDLHPRDTHGTPTQMVIAMGYPRDTHANGYRDIS